MIFQKLLFNENKLILNILPIYLPYSVFACLGEIIHLARHTFATTTTLSNRVPIETVSKMLGHTDIRTTQIYARVINSKISKDMKDLVGKLGDIEKAYDKSNDSTIKTA